MRGAWKFTAVGAIGSLVVRLMMATVRYRTENLQRIHRIHATGRRVIFAFWHGRMLIPACYYHHKPVRVLISRHADGEYIARVMMRLGFGTVRGSTTRGGAIALREILRMARQGTCDLAVTPDGPRGPRYACQPGAIFVAKATGMPIVPIGCGFDRSWAIKSWDAFRVPKPFAVARLLVGRPIAVPRDAGPEAMERYRQTVESDLRVLSREAEGER